LTRNVKLCMPPPGSWDLDLLTSKPNQLIFFPRYITDNSGIYRWRKMRQGQFFGGIY